VLSNSASTTSSPAGKFKSLVLKDEFEKPVEVNNFIMLLLAEPDVVKKGVSAASGPNRFLVIVTGGH
jgi:hypothetical protein